tara:strand:- start:964 stop:1158 length:195 start_codon:yes stop_codon:yes gene_type:complete
MPLFSDEINIFESYVKESHDDFNKNTITELNDLLEIVNTLDDNVFIKNTLINKITNLISKFKYK